VNGGSVRGGAAVRWVAVALIACAAAAGAAPPPGPAKQADQIRTLQDNGDYAKAAAGLRVLRGLVAPDADLELELALDEARSGQMDSAAARLWSPMLDSALVDTLPYTRRVGYPSNRGGWWLNGKFDGWYWYLARARAEVAAAQGRWDDALEAARACVAARPLEGKEWLVLAVCAARAGRMDEGAAAARQAAFLDPPLPEAQYVAGLYAWRAGRRTEAAESFARAMALDSTYRAAALARTRAELPFGSPPEFPTGFLIGDREAALLTSRVGPKLENNELTDTPPSAFQFTNVVIPDSLGWRPPGPSMQLAALIGTQGRIVLHEMPWFSPVLMPEQVVSLVNAMMPAWAFQPATRYGSPQASWTTLSIFFGTPDNPGSALKPPVWNDSTMTKGRQ
jgi:tetratricopeptide (TPR) repeat protein